MFNRANKITSLLVAAAAVASFVPATGVNAATRLSTKEGTINDAIAFNGKYIYEGYKSDDVDKAVWYNNGEKDVEVKDYDDENYTFTTNTYGEKYILAEDGDDNYLVDMTSGKVLDQTLDDKKDNTASALEKAIKKTDKFEDRKVDSDDLKQITPDYAKFQDPWYYADILNDEDKEVRVFTNESGKYITTDQLANIYAYSREKGKLVKINKFKEEEDKADKDNGLKAVLNKSIKPEVIAQDKDYIYAIINVDIYDTAGMTSAEKDEAVKAAEDRVKNAQETVDKYGTIGKTQKADLDAATEAQTKAEEKVTAAKEAEAKAKEAYDKAAEAYLADEATNKDAYEKAKADLEAAKKATADAEKASEAAKKATADAQKAYDDSIGKLGDDIKSANDELAAAKAALAALNTEGTESAIKTNAYYLQKISKAQGDKDGEAYMPKSVDSYLIDNKSLYDNGDCKDAYDWLINNNNNRKIVNVKVEGGNSLYVYKVDNDSDTKIKVEKLDLKKMKENPVDKTVYGDSKLDGYAVKKDGDSDRDCEKGAWSVDVNGNVWVLDDGKIVKFDKKDKTEVYTCDSGFDKLNVYDENNLIAWNEEDERYTTVTEGKKQTLDDATAIDPNANKPVEVKTGWQQDPTTKDWTLLGAKGEVLTGWQNVGGAWYYLDPSNNGIMVKGWKQLNGTWYYLSEESGAMVTGWLPQGGAWYYLEPVNSNGAMKTGWFQDTTGTWYFADGSGKMLSNTVVDGYVLGANGAWVK